MPPPPPPLLLLRWNLRQVHRLLVTDRITSEQLCTYCYAVAKAGDEIWDLNAFARMMPRDHVMERAVMADERRRRHDNSSGKNLLSLLDGIPVTIKSNLAYEGLPLTAGSRILGHHHCAATAAGGRATAEDESTTSSSPVLADDDDITAVDVDHNHFPSAAAVGYSADVVRRLVDESGAILIGATQMDEFGMGSLGNNIPLQQHQRQRKQQQREVTANVDDTAMTTTHTKNPLPFLHALMETGGNNQLTRNQPLNDEALVETLLQNEQVLEAQIIEAHERALQQLQSMTPYAAGGSSCGSAASVAHGSSLLSLASDTGGSIRLPAAFCGVVGVKPSYGTISRHGLVSYASSLDTVGLLAPTVDCATIALQEILDKQHNGGTGGDDPSPMIRDSTQYPKMLSIPSVINNSSEENSDPNTNSTATSSRLKGVTIGLPEAFSVEECPPQVSRAWSWGVDLLSNHGATIKHIESATIAPETIQNCLAAYYVLASAEASSNLARYDGFRYGVATNPDTAIKNWHDPDNQQNFSLLEQQYASNRTQGFGQEVIRRIMCGTFVLSSDKFHTYYEAATRLRAVTTIQLEQALSVDGDNGADVLLVPTAISHPPPSLDQPVNPTEMFANDVMTVPISLAGLPAVSVPINCPPNITEENEERNTMSAQRGPFLPSLQIIGRRHGGEETILRVAQLFDER